MKAPDVAVLDFETEPIQTRPHYPPKPVSMSIILPGQREPKFYAWGHKTGRGTHSFEEAYRALRQVRDCGAPVLCHNAKFDLDVAETHFGIRPWTWREFHDTQFLLFLVDPYAFSLGLKQQAEKRLGLPPDERDAVKDWLLEHKKDLEADFPAILAHEGIKPSNASAFICYAPPHIVGPYANGDVARTLALFENTWAYVQEHGMGAAYDRERRLMPYLLANERAGVRVDLTRLVELDRKMESESLPAVDNYLRARLGNLSVNLDSGAQVVEALKQSGLGEGFARTAKGGESRGLESIEGAVKDVDLKLALQYRTRLTNQHRNFIKGWVRQATATGGTLHTAWNQVKNGDDSLSGARTGRLSTDKPFNLLAITKGLGRRGKKAAHPHFLGAAAVELPHLRTLLLPDEGCLWVRRDFIGQELKVLSHFEGGELQHAHYDIAYDIHKHVIKLINQITGILLDRDQAKILNFGLIYGMGLDKLAKSLKVDVETARTIKRGHMQALRGVKRIMDDLKRRYRDNLPFKTWGGREIYAETARVIDGELRHFDYRMLNHLVQGSSAEVSKEAVIRFHEAGLASRFLGLVHDELNASAPKARAKEEALAIRDIMMSIEIDVPLLSGCEIGPSWGEVEEIEEPVPSLARWTDALAA